MVTNMISQLQESFPLKREKKSFLLCMNFISIYKINRTLHGRLGIRILYSSAESISDEWVKLVNLWEIHSYVKDKNSIFTARDEDTIF